MSMKPGATMWPVASSSRSPRSPSPIATTLPPEMATSARTPGAPVPSTTVPPFMTNSATVLSPRFAITRPPGLEHCSRGLSHEQPLARRRGHDCRHVDHPRAVTANGEDRPLTLVQPALALTVEREEERAVHLDR